MPQFECGAEHCEFLIRANDEDEIVAIVQRHAHRKHDRTVDEEYVRSRITNPQREDATERR